MKTKDFGVIPSPLDTRDLAYAVMPKAIERPDTFSLRNEQTPVRHQGGVGSCAAFAGCAVTEFLYEKKAYLSPRHLYCARPNKPQSGMFMRDVCKILQKQGVCMEQCWPYKAATNLCDNTQCTNAKVEAVQYRIGAYRRIYGSMKDALWTYKTPLFVCVPTYDGFPALSGNMREYHAITIMGYTKHKYEFKNSWGTDWGDNGYAKLIDTYPVTEAWLLESREMAPQPPTNVAITKTEMGAPGIFGIPINVHIQSNATYYLNVDGGRTFTWSVRRGITVAKIYVSPKEGITPLTLHIGTHVFKAAVSCVYGVSDWQTES